MITGNYPVALTISPGVEHPNLAEARDKIKEMYPAVRNPVPRDLTWLMTDSVISNFFWLHTDLPGKEKEIDATCRDNHLTVTTTTVTNATIFLDSRLIDSTNRSYWTSTDIPGLSSSLGPACGCFAKQCKNVMIPAWLSRRNGRWLCQSPNKRNYS